MAFAAGSAAAYYAATAVAVAAAAASGYASYRGAKAQEDSAQFEADVAAQNAEIARQEAHEAEEMQRRRARVALSSQRSRAAERGIDLAGSSAWDLYRQSAVDAEADALAIRRKGEMEGRGLDLQAEGSQFAARQARTQANIGAGATLLNMGSAAASGYANYGANQPATTTQPPGTTNNRPGRPKRLRGALS